jgi:hypothetical protein
MLGRFFVSSSYMFCILANEVSIVYCCTAPKCTGTTRTGNFEDFIISLSAAQVSMLIMYLSWNICYLLYGLYVTLLTWGPIETPFCRSLSSLMVLCLMFLLLSSGSVVQICVGSVVSSIAHTSVVKMDQERKSAACQVVMLVFWVEK